MASSTIPSPPGTPAEPLPLAAVLSALLPSSLSLKLYHVSTPPTKTAPLFAAAPNQEPMRTTLESHFLTLSHDGILFFAIEVLIYTVPKKQARTFFVSKADSSGYLPATHSSFIAADGTRKSTLRTISTAFITCLFTAAREADPHITATISLFARSQTQYLFPNSAVNAGKHVLTDRGLIAWWCKVLDPILQGQPGTKGYLLVPGFDRLEWRALLPPVKLPGHVEWVNGHPYELDGEGEVSVREIVPHFPDDPKARFLDELNAGEGDGKRASGWRDIKTLEQFWELMSFRQECSLGRCVGFLWLVAEGQKKVKKAVLETNNIPEESIPPPPLPLPLTPESSQPEARRDIAGPASESSDYTSAATESEPSTCRISPALPSPATSPRKRRSSSHTTIPPKKKLRSLSFAPAISAGSLVRSLLVLEDKAYGCVIDSLLNHSDFGKRETAVTASEKWIGGAQPGAADRTDWGVTVVGAMAQPAQASAGASSRSTAREKQNGTEQVNLLGPGLLRRKRTEEEKVNVLPAGLIRRKSKE